MKLTWRIQILLREKDLDTLRVKNGGLLRFMNSHFSIGDSLRLSWNKVDDRLVSDLQLSPRIKYEIMYVKQSGDCMIGLCEQSVDVALNAGGDEFQRLVP